MILHQQNGLNPFRTKKKSSDGSWAAWVSMLAVAIAASAAFSASEVLRMHPRTVKFMNLRSANLVDFRSNTIADEATVSDKTPLVYFMKDKVVFGSLGSVIAPRTSQDILILNKLSWKNELETKIKNWPKMKSLFPSKVVAYGFEKDENAKNAFDHIQSLGVLFKNFNKLSAGASATADAAANKIMGAPPVPVLVRIPWGE